MGDPPDRIDAWGGVAAGWAVTGEMLAALLVCGGIGYLIDRLAWGEALVFTPGGMVIGAVLGIYLIWLRFGREVGPRSDRSGARTEAAVPPPPAEPSGREAGRTRGR